jgi:hypothetical protein
MAIKIISSIASVAIISGICGGVKLLCKKYINSIDNKQSGKKGGGK